MKEFFKNFEPFCMNFRNFRDHVFEVCRFEDVRSTQISSVCDKNSEKATHLPELRLKKTHIPYVGNFT